MKIRNIQYKILACAATLVLVPLTMMGAQNIADSKASLSVIKAFSSGDTAFFSKALAPELSMQHASYLMPFSKSDLANFAKKQGELYGFLFDDKFVAKKLGKGYYSFATAFTKSYGISFAPSADDRFVLPSMTTVYQGQCYDILLNCTEDVKTCEISGLNISGCKNLDDVVLSTLANSEVELVQLTSKKYLAESRKWMSEGIRTIVITDNARKNKIFGPNAPFQVVFAGTEAGYGGVIYINTFTKENSSFYLMFRHLTTMNNKLMKFGPESPRHDAGTFIGGNNAKIGLVRSGEPARLTIEGRTNSGLPITESLLIQILQGKL